MSDQNQQAAQLGYAYGAAQRAFADFAKAFAAGFERGRNGTPLTPEQAAARRERLQVLAYQGRIKAEREKGRRFVEALLADLRRGVLR